MSPRCPFSLRQFIKWLETQYQYQHFVSVILLLFDWDKIEQKFIWEDKQKNSLENFENEEQRGESSINNRY